MDIQSRGSPLPFFARVRNGSTGCLRDLSVFLWPVRLVLATRAHNTINEAAPETRLPAWGIGRGRADEGGLNSI